MHALRSPVSRALLHLPSAATWPMPPTLQLAALAHVVTAMPMPMERVEGALVRCIHS